MSGGHVKQTYRLDAELVRLVAERARVRRVTRTEVVEAALASLLSPDHEERLEALVAKRLDRLSRQVERLQWHVELSNEALALFVRFWLTNHPAQPDAATKAAQAAGTQRYRNFIESLSRRMTAGPSLEVEMANDAPAPAGTARDAGREG